MEVQQPQAVPQIKTTPYASPMHQFGSSIIMMTNPENELYKMELTFRSMKLDGEGNPVSSGEPLMNDLGVSSIVGTTQALVNQVTVMSNLQKSDVPMLMDFIGDTIAKDLMCNRGAYEIDSQSARDKIFFTALATSFVTLKRAYEEGDRRFWKGSQQEITTRVDGTNQKGSFFKNLNPFK